MTSLPYLLGEEGFSAAAKSALEEMTQGLPLLAQVEKREVKGYVSLCWCTVSTIRKGSLCSYPVYLHTPQVTDCHTSGIPLVQIWKTEGEQVCNTIFYFFGNMTASTLTVYVKPLHLYKYSNGFMLLMFFSCYSSWCL